MRPASARFRCFTTATRGQQQIKASKGRERMSRVSVSQQLKHVVEEVNPSVPVVRKQILPVCYKCHDLYRDVKSWSRVHFKRRSVRIFFANDCLVFSRLHWRRGLVSEPFPIHDPANIDICSRTRSFSPILDSGSTSVRPPWRSRAEERSSRSCTTLDSRYRGRAR